MLKLKSSRLSMAVPLVAAIILVAGGVAVASNMGVKMHKGLPFARAGAVGNNWTSLAFRSPYSNAGILCTQTGMTSTGLFRATVTRVDPVTGAQTQASCGTAGATSLTLTPGLGVIIRQPLQCSDGTGNCAAVAFGGACPDGTGTCTAGPGTVTAAGSSIHIVGAHDPALTLNVTRAGAGSNGDFLYATVFHATATNFQQICDQIGMTNTGLFRGTVQRLAASTGTTIQRSCGTAAAAAEALVLGEAIKLRQPLVCSDNTGNCTGIAFGAACSDGSGTCTAGTPVAPGVLPFTPQHF
jgi:hypothetical protein